MGEECVQDAARALDVLSRPERLLEVREHPDDRPLREAVDDLLHPRFEHPDERLARVHVCRACLEANRSLPSRRSASTINSSCRRPGRRRRGRERGRTPRARRRVRPPPRSGCRRASPEAASPDRHAARLTEEVDVDRRRLPLLERGRSAAFVATLVPSISSRMSGCRPASSSSSSSTVTTSPATTRASRKRETSRASGLPGPFLLRVASTGGITVPSLSASARRSSSRSPRSPRSKRLSAPSVHPAGAGRPAAIAAMAPARRNFAPRSATSANVSSSMLSGSASNSTRRSNSSSTQLVDVDPRVRRRKLLPEVDHLLDGVFFRLRTLRGFCSYTGRVQEFSPSPNEVAAELAGAGDGVLQALRDAAELHPAPARQPAHARRRRRHVAGGPRGDRRARRAGRGRARDRRRTPLTPSLAALDQPRTSARSSTTSSGAIAARRSRRRP